MGHLSNPIGLRLGFEQKWIFQFFIKNMYYPEFINNLINIRDYIYYYLTRNKILQSGLCFSHLLLFKISKRYYTKIYIYHIDLEKQSYDYINILYQNYYDAYNKVNCKFIKNRTIQQTNFYHNARDLSNSDLFLFYFNCLAFYQAVPLIKPSKFLKKNKYFNNVFIRVYSRYIIYKYLKKFFFNKINNRRWNYWTIEGKINPLIKAQDIFRSKQRIQRRKYFLAQSRKKKKYRMLKKAKFILKYILKKIGYYKYYKYLAITKIKNHIMRNLQLKLKNLSDKEKTLLDKCLNFIFKYNIKKRIQKIFVSYYKKLSKKNKAALKMSKKTRLKDTFYDSKFKKQHWATIAHINFIDYYKKRFFNKLNILILFLYLAKKVNFKKVRNSKSLKTKWLIIAKYIKMFSLTNYLNVKGSGLISIKPFIFLLHMFITLSKWSSKNIGIMFNLKDALYHSIYFGIFFKSFFPALKLMVFFLKQGLHILCNSIKNNIIFYFFFLTNQNVTSQLIARYIALKLQKGFTLKKILYPLKRELIRVAHKSRGNQKPYKSFNFSEMYKKNKVLLRDCFKRYTKYYFNFFLINFFNNFKNNETLIYFNMFYDKHKKYKNKKLIKKLIVLNKYKTRLFAYYKSIISSYFSAEKIKIKEIKDKNNKLKKWKKILQLNMIYPFIFNFDKKKSLYIVSFYKLDYIKNAYLNSFKLLNSNIFINTRKVLNSKSITISSFFFKNYINFNMIKSLWLIYKKFNVRNFRQKYIAVYKSAIMGFKIVFKGRFSRKLRASKATLNIGKVPLNTLNAKIDYTFLPITLKNSVVSIKLYIYKNKIFQGYKNMVKI